MILRYINELLGTAFTTEEEALEALVQADFLENHKDTTRDFLSVYSSVCKTQPTLNIYVEGMRNIVRLADSADEGLRAKMLASSPSKNAYLYDKILVGIGFRTLEKEYRYMLSRKVPHNAEKHSDFLSYKVNIEVKQTLAFKTFVENGVLAEEGKRLIDTARAKRDSDDVTLTNIEFADDDEVIHTTFDVVYSLILSLANKAKHAVKEFTEQQVNIILKHLTDRVGNEDFKLLWEQLNNDPQEYDLQELNRKTHILVRKYVEQRFGVLEFNRETFKDSAEILSLLVWGLYTRNKSMLLNIAFLIDTIEKRRIKLGTF